jgi:hypothetical protein
MKTKELIDSDWRNIMTWYQLFKRLGKQTIHKMQNTEISVKLRDGTEHKCKLEFYNNGSEFRLVAIN